MDKIRKKINENIDFIAVIASLIGILFATLAAGIRYFSTIKYEFWSLAAMVLAIAFVFATMIIVLFQFGISGRRISRVFLRLIVEISFLAIWIALIWTMKIYIMPFLFQFMGVHVDEGMQNLFSIIFVITMLIIILPYLIIKILHEIIYLVGHRKE
ncbi:MAG: hypothetical protein ACFFGZ_16885 [Candidatus Thorarchaeota archaeon]